MIYTCHQGYPPPHLEDRQESFSREHLRGANKLRPKENQRETRVPASLAARILIPPS